MYVQMCARNMRELNAFLIAYRKTPLILCTKGNSLKQYGTSIQQSWTERKATATLQILDTLYLHHAYCADFTIQSSCCHSLNPRQSTAISNSFFFLTLKGICAAGKLRHTHMVFTLLLFCWEKTNNTYKSTHCM